MQKDFRKGKIGKRRVATRDTRPKIVVFSEDKNTEPQYFNGPKRHFSSLLIELEIYPAQGVPMTLVEAASKKFSELYKYAKKTGNSFDQNFEVWAVFDVDEHPHIEDAKAIAKANKVKIACSNPCFEIWLVYHFEDFNKPIDRHRLQSYATEIIPSYDHKEGKSLSFEDFADKTDTAINNSINGLVRRDAEGTAEGNPSSTVFALARSIVRNGKAAS